MAEITYLTKLCKEEFSSADNRFDFPLPVPRYCPICQMPQRGTVSDRKLWKINGNNYYGTIMYTCNNCSGKYLVNYDLDISGKAGHFGSFHPIVAVTYENQLLEKVSPRFVQLYEQALRAESIGSIDLAGTGYRDALECLVKDYAINVLHESSDEVKNKKLAAAITQYLETDMASTADVVRILGNDLTHYERKHPDIDFPVLKDYMNIFIRLVEDKVRSKQPPVSR